MTAERPTAEERANLLLEENGRILNGNFSRTAIFVVLREAIRAAEADTLERCEKACQEVADSLYNEVRRGAIKCVSAIRALKGGGT